MAPSTIRKAIGVMKDQTSISIAKVASTLDPELEILIVKATSHDDDIPNSKYLKEILVRTSSSRTLVAACVNLISKRIERTRDWIVALKSLILLHRLLVDGGQVFKEEIGNANVNSKDKVGMLSHLYEFKDESHSNSSDFSEFVRRYGRYLDEKIDLMMFDKMWLQKRVSSSEGNLSEGVQIQFSEMATERVLIKMEELQSLLERVLGCRPRGISKNHKIVILALFPVVEESFQLYTDICEGLSVLLDRFWGMEYKNSAKTFGTYVTVAKQIDELVEFYAWCEDAGVARPLDYPQIERVSDDLLRAFEDHLKSRKNNMMNVGKNTKVGGSLSQIREEPENVDVEDPKPEPVVVENLVDLGDEYDESWIEKQDNKLALALFSETPIANTTTSTPWGEFPDIGVSEVTSGWETRAADPSNVDWELDLVETASNLAKQKAELGGGFDALTLNGMYYQGSATKNVQCTQLSSGSDSSLALPLPEKSGNAILALTDGEQPEGSTRMVNRDPFEACLAIPPPPYVQIAEMEQKRQLMVQEQQLWQQYSASGMQGQVSGGSVQNQTLYNAGFPQEALQPYWMPNNMGYPGGYHYHSK